MLPPELYTVAEIATFSKLTLRANEHEFVDYLDTGNLTEGLIQSLEHYSDLSKLPSRAKKIVIEGDILFSTVRPNNRHYGIIHGNSKNLVVSTGFSVIRANRNIVLPEYLYYHLTSNSTVELLQSIAEQSVSAYPSINDSDIGKLEFKIPDTQIQKAVIKIIESINQKLSINREINANLLKSARVAFSEMMCTSELSDAVLSDVATITMGQSPPGDSLSEDDTGVLFYQGRAEFGSVFPTPRLYTTDPKRMAKQGSILMSVRAPVGDINVALEKCCIGRGLAAIESNNGMQGFVHYLMDYLKPELDVFNGGGTVFGSINKESVNGLEISLPEQKSAEQFNAYAEKIDAEIRSNHLEMLKLSEIRDYLLPRLMSGEIDVSTSEIPN